MNYLILVNRGSGAEFMQVSVIRDFAAEHKDDKVYVSAVNKYFADMLAAETENVESIDRNEIYPLFTSIMQSKKNWKVLQPEVYQTDRFFLREDNFYDCYRELLGMKRRNDWSKDGSEYTPYLSVIPDQLKKEASEFARQHPNFVLFQRQGGINPSTPPQERVKAVQAGEHGLKRAYPIKESEKLVALLQKTGYEVLQYCLPEEPHIKGTLYIQQEQNQLMYYELARYCKGVITIDSSLMHLSIHNAPKVVAVWLQSASGENDCRGFGYKKARNVYAHNYRPVSPYFNGIPDSPVIEYPTPEEIMEAFVKEEPKEKK